MAKIYGVPDAPRVSAGDCRQQGRCRSRNAAGNGEHPAIDQRIHADRGDDRVEPHEADQDAIHDSGGERAAQREQHGGRQIGAVAGRNVSRNHNRERHAARDREIEPSLLDDQHLSQSDNDEDRGEGQAARQGAVGDAGRRK